MASESSAHRLRCCFILVLPLLLIGVTGCVSGYTNLQHEVCDKATVGEDCFVEVDSRTIHYVRAGSGQPLILIPGAFSTYRTWDRMIPELSLRFEVLALDYVGTGDSDKPAEGFDYSVESQATMVAGLIRKLGLPPVRIIGVSYGSAIALNIACRFPELVDRIACIEGGALIQPGELGYSGAGVFLGIRSTCETFLAVMRCGLFYESIARAVMEDGWDNLSEEEKAQVTEIMASGIRTSCGVAWMGIYEAITSRIDFTAAAAGMKVPVIYLYGESSRYLEVARTNADFLANNLPHVEIASVEGGIHDLQLQFPQQVTQAIFQSWGMESGAVASREVEEGAPPSATNPAGTVRMSNPVK